MAVPPLLCVCVGGEQIPAAEQLAAQLCAHPDRAAAIPSAPAGSGAADTGRLSPRCCSESDRRSAAVVPALCPGLGPALG